MNDQHSRRGLSAPVLAETMLEVIHSRFTSGNQVPVERAYIKAEEWHQLLQQIELIRQEAFRRGYVEASIDLGDIGD